MGSFLPGSNNAKEGFSWATTAERFVAHGLVGGLFNAGQKGGFGSGFLAAGLGSVADDVPFDSGNGVVDFVGKLALHAAVGGAGAVLGGGKFANGAETGSFGYLFNFLTECCGGPNSDEAQYLRKAVVAAGNEFDNSFDWNAYVEAYTGDFAKLNSIDKLDLSGWQPVSCAHGDCFEHTIPDDSNIAVKIYGHDPLNNGINSITLTAPTRGSFFGLGLSHLLGLPYFLTNDRMHINPSFGVPIDGPPINYLNARAFCTNTGKC